MILRILAIIALVVITAWLVNYFRKNKGDWDAAKTWTRREMKAVFSKDFCKEWRRTAFFVLLMVIDILALTSIIPWLILGTPLGGFALMLHQVMAPLFAILMTIVVLSWADKQTFNKNSIEFIKARLQKKEEATSLADEFYTRFFFWFMLIFSIITASMVFSMYPIFGAIGQKTLLTIHRVAAIALFIFVILFTLHFIRLQSADEEKK